MASDDFKAFVGRAGLTARRELFLVQNKAQMQDLQKRMFNEAGERGLCPIWRSMDHVMLLGDSIAAIRIVHQNIDRHMAGTTWHAIHGMELLNDFDRPYDMKARLASLVRLP